MNCIVRQYGFGGGAPLSLLQHYLVLKRIGYNKIICMANSNNSSVQAQYEEAFGKIINKKSPGELWDDSKKLESYKQYRWEYKFIRKEKPDLIVALGELNGALYSYMCRKLGIPLIIYIAGGTLIAHRQVIDMWKDCEVVCFSKENKDVIKEHYPQEHIHVISNRISRVQRFDDFEAHYQMEQPEIHVLITSRLSDDKIQSVFYLLQMLYQCANKDVSIVVRIAGDGPQKDTLISFCNETQSEHLHIQYLGHLDDLTEQFGWAHIAAGKGRSVIEPIMMNRIGCIIGEDGKIAFCNEKNFEHIYHYNFSGRNLKTEDSLKLLQEMIIKIQMGKISEKDVIVPAKTVRAYYSAEYLPEKLMEVVDKLPSPKHVRKKAFLLVQFVNYFHQFFRQVFS